MLEWRTGSSAEDSAVFANVTALAANAHEWVVVADQGTRRVTQFDSAGRFVRALGRTGSGPGEFRVPTGVAYLDDGRVYLRDFPSRVNVYDADGRSLRSIRLPSSEVMGRIALMPTRSALFAALPGYESPQGEIVRLLRIDLATDSVTPVVVPAIMPEACTGNVVVNGQPMRVPFEPRRAWMVLWDESFAAGCPRDYSFRIADSAGAVLDVRGPGGSVVATNAERHGQRDRINRGLSLEGPWSWDGDEIPRTKPPYRTILASPDNLIWVIAEEAATPDAYAGAPSTWRRRWRFDVFDRNGRHVASVPVPREARIEPEPVIVTNAVFFMVLDDDGAPYLSKYRLVRSDGPPP